MLPGFEVDEDCVLAHKIHIKIKGFQSLRENISPKDPSASTYVKYSVAAALNSLLDSLLVLLVPPMVVEH